MISLLLGLANTGFALPACPSSGHFNNCYGTFTWDNGDKYLGEWKDNKRHGQGIYKYVNGNKYAGEFKNNYLHGQGTFTWGPNTEWAGDKYVGEFKKSLRHGQGTYNFANGNKHVGEYKDNNRDGQGTYTYTDGSRYIGEHKNNSRHGQGTFIFADGSKWIGAWENGYLNGYAIKYYADGSIDQEGIFKDDKFLYEEKRSATNSALPACPKSGYFHNCYGSYTFASGNTYVGEFKDTKRHGQGTFTWADGEKYIGGFKDDNFHGQGTYTFADGSEWAGDKYIGEYKEGKKHGQGTYTFADGSKEVGEWKNNKLNGYAIKYYADGSIKQEGIFKNDKFLYAQKSQDNANNCAEDPAFCTIVQLCSKASFYTNGEKAWKTDYNSKKYVIEAEKNGVTCGVKSEIAKSTTEEILPAASGSGFFITKNGHVITNEHVIEGCEQVKVHYDGSVHESVILSSDKFNDLALIKINYNPEVVFSLATDSPYLGQDIIAAGYPLVSDLGNTLKVTSGIVSALSAIDDTSKFQMDVPVQPGNSGGPIFDINGNILGVVVARSTHEETQLVNFGIKAATVRNLIDANNIKLQPPNIEPINKRKFSEAMTKGTVLLSCWMTLTQIEEFNTQSSGKVFFKEFRR